MDAQAAKSNDIPTLPSLVCVKRPYILTTGRLYLL